MYIIDQIKFRLAKRINLAINQELVKPELLVYPPNVEMGDLSLACFIIAKEQQKNPAEVAAHIEKIISAQLEAMKKTGKIDPCFLSSVKAMGPYINFNLDRAALGKMIVEEVAYSKNEYGKNESGFGKKVMIEYSNSNTHKEVHVGHLRNISYGDSVNRILAANGFKAIPVSYINDFGIHAAKTLWAYDKFFKDKPLPENKGFFLGQIYVRATKELAKKEKYKEEVGEYMKKIESRQGRESKLWEKTRKWSIEQLAVIYKELGIRFDQTFYESEFIDKGLKIVGDLKKKGISKESQGAVIADLEEYGLGVLVFLRADGTALYPVADLSLAIAKSKKYKLDKSIYVVDIRQGLHFKQLFKVLELLGHKEELVHLGYDFVKLPSGMMSSRTGNIITYEDLRAKLMQKSIKETKKRHKDWSEKKIAATAGKIVNGAMKFEMIKVSAQSVITFDIEGSLRFDGFTAAYLQYTYARMNSIIKKAKKQINKETKSYQGIGGEGNLSVEDKEVAESKEHALIMKMMKYSEVVKKAGESYDPSEIAKYIFELAQLANDYYHSVPVLKAEEETRKARLALLGSINQVLKNGLGILGIETVDEM